MKSKKVPTPNGNASGGCLAAGVFSSRWKVARVVLISKRKATSKSHCQSMLRTAVHLLEKFIKPRFIDEIRAVADLYYFAFKPGKSKIDAIEEVV